MLSIIIIGVYIFVTQTDKISFGNVFDVVYEADGSLQNALGFPYGNKCMIDVVHLFLHE